MSSKYNKYVTLTTVITILVMLLFTTGEINQELFLILFIPLAPVMLILGILELRK